jgi:hypothetical protein
MKSAAKFNGEKESYADWFRTLKIELLRMGIFTIATGERIRPANVEHAFWHLNDGLAANLASLEARLSFNRKNGRKIMARPMQQ